MSGDTNIWFASEVEMANICTCGYGVRLLCSLGSTIQPPEWHHLHNWITLRGVVQEFLYEAELSVYFAPLLPQRLQPCGAGGVAQWAFV